MFKRLLGTLTQRARVEFEYQRMRLALAILRAVVQRGSPRLSESALRGAMWAIDMIELMVVARRKVAPWTW